MCRIASLILLCLLIVFYSSNSYGQVPELAIFFGGEEIKLTVKNEKGRFYGLKAEIMELLPEIFLPYEGLNENGSHWLPLRNFWEGLGFKVIWLPEIQTIVVRENTVVLELPAEVISTMTGAVADTDWLAKNSRIELQSHFISFYTPEIVEELVEDTWEFVRVETDWHSTYQLIEFNVLDGTEDWYLLQILVKEDIFSEATSVLMHGVMKLQKSDLGWRISAYKYYQND